MKGRSLEAPLTDRTAYVRAWFGGEVERQGSKLLASDQNDETFGRRISGPMPGHAL